MHPALTQFKVVGDVGEHGFEARGIVGLIDRAPELGGRGSGEGDGGIG